MVFYFKFVVTPSRLCLCLCELYACHSCDWELRKQRWGPEAAPVTVVDGRAACGRASPERFSDGGLGGVSCFTGRIPLGHKSTF